MHAPYRAHRIVPAATAVDPPLDTLTTPSNAYSFRKLRSAYAGNAIRIRRASDNAEIDIGFSGFCPWPRRALERGGGGSALHQHDVFCPHGLQPIRRRHARLGADDGG